MDGILKLSKAGADRLLSEEEAIEQLGLHTRRNPKGALRWLMRTRRLAYVRLARGIYGFRQADLDAFVESCRVAAAGARTKKRQENAPGT